MRFKLLVTHYIDDQLLEAGTEIGDGTSVPFRYPDNSPRTPSPEGQMEGLDDEGKAMVAAITARSTVPLSELALNVDPAGAANNQQVPDPVDPSKVKGAK